MRESLIVACGLLLLLWLGDAHEAKDFDDSILYKIDFEIPDFDKEPDLRNQIRTFYTHEHEKYDCVIPVLNDAKEEQKTNEPELSPYVLLQPIFTAHSCSYRIEAYWSYEICHGHHVRQYHEEREGKNIKFQEYYLGKWNEVNADKLLKAWEEDRKAGIKYKTTKIESTKYRYFEMEMSDGTMCDIINAPRTTIVRYVCYPHGKNEIYSFKETSSCNYEAIILTSALCMIPAFHPEESKEVSVKCFNSPTEPHKPLSMLVQELNDMQASEDDFPVSKEANAAAAAALALNANSGDRYVFLNKFGDDIEKLVLELLTGAGIEVETSVEGATDDAISKVTKAPITDVTPIKDFISGKHCLTGGSGWWKFEFCYGRHVRQFHKDKKSETELYLGYFSPDAHRQWITATPEKSPKAVAQSNTLWHHYGKGSHCDRTNLPREVDVKLSCTYSGNAAPISMYLLEPRTCQYILVVESPIVCDIIQLADEFGLVDEDRLMKYLQKNDIDAEMADKLSTTKSTASSVTGSDRTNDPLQDEGA